MKKINKYIIILYIISAITLFLHRIATSDYYHAFLALASPLFLFVPAIIYKLFHIPKNELITFSIYIFCILSFTIGMAFGGYKTIPYYDKIVHALSGVFFAFIGYLLFYTLKSEHTIKSDDKWAAVYTSFSTAMTSAALWEVYEYLYSLFSKTDPQGVLTSGISDTMLDTIGCGIGAIIFCIILYIKYTKNSRILFEDIINSIIKSKI